MQTNTAINISDDLALASIPKDLKAGIQRAFGACPLGHRRFTPMFK